MTVVSANGDAVPGMVTSPPRCADRAGVGLAQAAFDHTAAHLAHRRAFGGPLAGKQHWQFLMADRATSIASAGPLSKSGTTPRFRYRVS